MTTHSDTPPDRPQTLAELIWYTRYYESDIYVRAQRNGRWESLALSELSLAEWAEKLAGFLERGIIPVRVLSRAEDNSC